MRMTRGLSTNVRHVTNTATALFNANSCSRNSQGPQCCPGCISRIRFLSTLLDNFTPSALLNTPRCPLSHPSHSRWLGLLTCWLPPSMWTRATPQRNRTLLSKVKPSAGATTPAHLTYSRAWFRPFSPPTAPSVLLLFGHPVTKMPLLLSSNSKISTFAFATGNHPISLLPLQQKSSR